MANFETKKEAIGSSFEIACGDHPEIKDKSYYVFGRDWKNAEEKKYTNWFVFRIGEAIKATPFRTASAQEKLAVGNGELKHAFLGDVSEATRTMVLKKWLLYSRLRINNLLTCSSTVNCRPISRKKF